MSATLRIALVQMNPTVGDLEGNAAKITSFLDAARERGADLVAFPELAICGYPPEDLLFRRRFLLDCREVLGEVVPKAGGLTALVGFPDLDEAGIYNAAAVIGEGGVAGVYHKAELPNYGVFDEKRYFSPGRGPLILEAPGLRAAVTICEDLWVERGEAERSVARNRADVVVNLSASPFHAGKRDRRVEVIAGFARRTGTYVCYVNQVGGQDELVFDGGSMVVDPGGAPVASARRFAEALLVVDIPASPDAERIVSPVRPSELVALSCRSSHIEPAVSALAPELDRLDEIHAALVLGTRDYVSKNGFLKAVVGLSGGIDSSLTAAIAVEALGPDNVIGVTMPSRYSSVETRRDAAVLAGHLGISLLTIPIHNVFSTYLEMLEEAFGPGEPGIERENLQARIRGNALMALSNRHGWLVLTTGNKSEIAVGYCTLYGDTAGGFAVIKDVPKTLVYELTERMNARAGRSIIPRSVIERPPTAELKEDQIDQDSLPPYEELDRVLEAYVERDMAPDEIVAKGFDASLVRSVVALVDRSEYKRRQAPPGVKITPKAFGRDRRQPITNRYRGRR